MHKRRQLLEALRNQLKDSREFGAVWIQRALPARPVYPVITLYAESELVEHLEIHNQPRDQEREILVSVTVWVRGTPDDERTESRMDQLAEQVEMALRPTDDMCDLSLISTDFQVDEQEPEIHAVILTYRVQYQTIEFLPNNT